MTSKLEFNVAGVVEDTFKVAESLGRKFEASDVTSMLRNWACEYTEAYDGDFEFMVQMRAAWIKWGNLTDGQVKGVLNCMAAEARRTLKAKAAASPSATSEPTSSVAPQRDGTYTIILDEESGERITIRLQTMKPEQLAKYKKLEGTQVIEYMSGPDNETSYTGFGFVTGRKVGIWKKFRQAVEMGTVGAKERLAKLEIASELIMDADAETLHSFGYAWALVSGKCYICGRKLTVPASLCKGIGPICDGKGE